MPMSPSVSRTLRAGLTVFVLAMLVLFATKVNWRDTWGAMRGSSFPLLLFAAVLNIAAGVVKGIRWWVFLRPIGVTSLSLALRATFAGAGLNNVLIANGGEAARVIFVARSAHVDSARVVATLALERLFDLVGYVVLLTLAALFLELPPSLDRLRPYAIASPLLVGVLLGWLLRHPHIVEAVTVPGSTSLESFALRRGASAECVCMGAPGADVPDDGERSALPDFDWRHRRGTPRRQRRFRAARDPRPPTPPQQWRSDLTAARQSRSPF